MQFLQQGFGQQVADAIGRCSDPDCSVAGYATLCGAQEDLVAAEEGVGGGVREWIARFAASAGVEPGRVGDDEVVDVAGVEVCDVVDNDAGRPLSPGDVFGGVGGELGISLDEVECFDPASDVGGEQSEDGAACAQIDNMTRGVMAKELAEDGRFRAGAVPTLRLSEPKGQAWNHGVAQAMGQRRCPGAFARCGVWAHGCLERHPEDAIELAS